MRYMLMSMAVLMLSGCGGGGGANDSGSSGSSSSCGGSSKKAVTYPQAADVISAFESGWEAGDADKIVSCMHFIRYRGRSAEEEKAAVAKEFERGNKIRYKFAAPEIKDDAGTVKATMNQMDKDGKERSRETTLFVFKTEEGWRLSKYEHDSAAVTKQRAVMVIAMQKANDEVKSMKEDYIKLGAFLKNLKTISDVKMSDGDCEGTGLKAADFKFNYTDMGIFQVYVGVSASDLKNLRLSNITDMGGSGEFKLTFNR